MLVAHGSFSADVDVEVADLVGETWRAAPSTFGLGVVRVRFPRADSALVAARLARWNAGDRGPFGAPTSP